jgi:hypothetical protein
LIKTSSHGWLVKRNEGGETMTFHERARVLGSVSALLSVGVSGNALAMPIMDDTEPFPVSSPIDPEQAEAKPAAAMQSDEAKLLGEIRAELAQQREVLKAQAKQIAEQQEQIRLLTLQQQTSESLAEMRGAGAQEVAQGTQAPVEPPSQPVGEAPPPDREVAPRVAAVPEGQGVLTPRGRTIIEPSFEFTRSSANRLVFRGFELIPGIQIGVIEASDVDRDAMAGTIAVRHGLTNRLEIEGRMPVLARRDRIQVAQLRNQGIVREIKLNGYDIGDAEIGLRYQFNRQKGPEQPIYVGTLRLKTPTGRGPFDMTNLAWRRALPPVPDSGRSRRAPASCCLQIRA